MNKIFLLLICLSISCVVFSQDKNYVKHTVADGETVFQISKKYKVTTNQIFDLNPDAKTGIQVDMVLIIPSKTNKISEKTKETILQNYPKSHKVVAKETLYSLARQYEISVGDLKKANPILDTEGLKIDQIITIPTTKNTETKTETPSKPVVNTTVKSTQYVDYVVQAKETLYGLSKKFNIKLEDLIILNPQLENGVQEAMTIKVPSTIENQKLIVVEKTETTTIPVVTPTEPTPYIKRSFTDLSKTVNSSTKKQLVLLLPFNVSRIQNDTITSSQQRLKTDKFLNMALDFYSGALMAIDSAKSLKMNIDVKIFDSQETKTTSNIDNLSNEHDFKSAHAIIGPFYQSQADKLAGLLEENKVPVISPLSKEMAKPYSNSYSTMPSGDLIKGAMFDYMREKEGNIIAVIDPKKAAIKQYITVNQPDVKFTDVTEKGSLSTESLKSMLVKDKINFVVFASERTGTIFAITNTLINALPNYQIRLVILEPNPTFDFEEISLNRLTKLKLTYPSLTRDNETDKAKIFAKEYKKVNKIFPNQHATRGFDITFDTMLRLSQDKSFEETTIDYATEQVENKFDYNAKQAGGFANRGVYILQYNSDLTITEAE